MALPPPRHERRYAFMHTRMRIYILTQSRRVQTETTGQKFIQTQLALCAPASSRRSSPPLWLW